jgi:hypothetical protein
MLTRAPFVGLDRRTGRARIIPTSGYAFPVSPKSPPDMRKYANYRTRPGGTVSLENVAVPS